MDYLGYFYGHCNQFGQLQDYLDDFVKYGGKDTPRIVETKFFSIRVPFYDKELFENYLLHCKNIDCFRNFCKDAYLGKMLPKKIWELGLKAGNFTPWYYPDSNLREVKLKLPSTENDFKVIARRYDYLELPHVKDKKL